MTVQQPVNLSIKRTGRATYTVGWKYKPSAFDKDQWGTNFTQNVTIYAQVNYSAGSSEKKTVAILNDTHEDLKSLTSKTIDLAKHFGNPYPQSSKKWNAVKFYVECCGNKWERPGGKWKLVYKREGQWVVFNLAVPKQPTIEQSFNVGTGIISYRIKTASANDTREERYNTRYRVTRKDSANRNNSYKSEKDVRSWVESTSTDFTYTYDVSDHQSILQDQNITIKCYAYAKGARGDSVTSTSQRMIAHPSAATVSSITATSPANGVVTILMKTNATATRPVEQVKLERLTNTTIGTAATAAASLDWEYVSGAVDNGTCTGFTDQKTAAMPDVRKHTWYRIETKYGNNIVHGMPVEAKVLYRAKDTASGQAITFRSMELNSEGDGIRMELGWPQDNYLDNEITWSSYEDAWESNKRPSSLIMDWEDTTPASGFAHSGAVVIRGLEAGEPCYVRVRRRFDNGEVVMNGEWNTPPKQYYPIDIGGTMGNVVLRIPESVVRTEGVDCQWEFDGDEPKSWYMYSIDGETVVTLASGNGPANRCTIPASRLEGLSQVTLRLGLMSGGSMVYSDDRTVGIHDIPVVTVSAPATLTAQPLQLSMTSSLDGIAAKVYVTASGNMTNITPTGGEQVAGDIIWAEYVRPAWTAGQDEYTATIEAPSGLAFVDGADYTVSVVGVDESTGLSSEEATDSMTVEWAHQAQPAGENTEIVPDAENLRVLITADEPENAEESASYALTEDEEVIDGKTYYTRSGSEGSYIYTPVENPSAASLDSYYERTLSDVCDVYRLTPDGCELVYKGLEFGVTCIDPFAPFAEDGIATLEYRLCTRTIDGDLVWDEFGYEMESNAIRIDWADESIELPLGISAVDAFAKPFDVSNRWDGSRIGQWEAGYTRTSKLASTVLRADGPTQGPLLRSLGEYSGPCFVRTPDGCAYEAHVALNTYGASFYSPTVPVSIDTTQVTLTGDYMARLYDPEPEPESEESE